jgi:hypothetical protein
MISKTSEQNHVLQQNFCIILNKHELFLLM